MHLVWEIELPEFLYGIPTREINKLARDSLTRLLIYHHVNRIPKHFRQDARQKYGYKERSPRYRGMKRRIFKAGTRDLVFTGETEKVMTKVPMLTFSGSWDNSSKGPGLTGTLKYRFPHTAENPKNKGVTIHDMTEELARITLDEANEIIHQFEVDFHKTLFGRFSQKKKTFYSTYRSGFTRNQA